MDNSVTIDFFDMKHTELGSVSVENGKLVPSNDFAQRMVAFHTQRDMSTDAWVAKYSDWTNGYLSSKVRS